MDVQPHAPTPGGQPLVAAITDFLADQDPERLATIRERLHLELERAGQSALVELQSRLAADVTDWGFHPRDPLARQIHHALADSLLASESGLAGLEHVHAVAGRPVAIFANHLSYADANLLEILLQRFGASALADRLTAIAGPKVYSSRTRRFSSLCFGTVRTPQNSGVASEDAVMSARDVAAAAQHSIEVAQGRMARGEALLIFAEGTRSRTGQMQPLLMGATRYLDVPDAVILPIGITGTEAMFPVGEGIFRAVPIAAMAGAPIDVARLRRCAGTRRVTIDAIGVAIADLLPRDYRGIYGDDSLPTTRARQALARAR